MSVLRTNGPLVCSVLCHFSRPTLSHVHVKTSNYPLSLTDTLVIDFYLIKAVISKMIYIPASVF